MTRELSDDEVKGIFSLFSYPEGVTWEFGGSNANSLVPRTIFYIRLNKHKYYSLILSFHVEVLLQGPEYANSIINDACKRFTLKPNLDKRNENE